MPVGTIPAGARPASSHQTTAAVPPRDDSLELIVSAGRGYYARAAVATLLRLSASELDAAVTARTVLCLRDGEGTQVFPSWQFTASGEVLPFLSSILVALARGIADPWSWALWLTSPFGDDAEGPTAVDLLSSGSDPRPILDEANRDARRWAT